VALLLACAAIGTACRGGAAPTGAASSPTEAAPVAAAAAPAAAGTPSVAAGTQAAEPGAPVKQRELPEAAFIDTDENRDPFRPYVQIIVGPRLPQGVEAESTEVILARHSLDELRLIAIVSGEGGNPRAMLVDPDGKGWVVRRGDYVGRGDRVVVAPGQPEREINWRVVRVHPDRIILVREDPSGIGNPVTRVMRLYPEEEEGNPS
jgi:type IV pilus assembly protein PilP